MKREPVVSSVLRSIGYSAQAMILEVEFVGQNEIYQYHNVDTKVYNELMQASSHGKYFNANIKEHYPFTKVIR